MPRFGFQASGERIDVVVFGSNGYFGPTTLTYDDLVVGGALNSMIQLPSMLGESTQLHMNVRNLSNSPNFVP